MITIKIKTIWQGKIGIREKYIKQALESKQDLNFQKGNDYMVVPFKEIDKMMVGKSEHPVEDKFSNEFHYLCYFDWRPTTKQANLFE